jgi:hypothetical protein
LHEVHAAKEPRHEIGRCRTDRTENDAAAPSDEPEPASTASSCTTRDGQACERTAEPVRHDAEAATPAAVNDVTTQSVLLALIAQPAVKPDPQSQTKTSSTEQANTAMESVMSPVMEDGASLPATAADSSTLSQGDSKESTAQSADLAAAIPSGAVLSAPGETKGPATSSSKEEAILDSPAQPAPEEQRDARPEKPAFSITHEEQPHDSMKVAANAQPAALPNDQRPEMPDHHDTVKVPAAEQVQRPDENRPVVTERPVPTREAAEPKEDAAARHLSVTSTAWEEFTNQNQERGMEWSGRDQRERPSGDQVMTQAAMTEAAAPAVPSNATLLVNGLDQRAFSSAPSAKLPADVHPAASVQTPPVQPTDWMPGNSAGQTKSMVLELSQADLGRVNIRVAVNQDIVHTHFSSDRSDMGQYLQSGQERLQSALQTSGLDLGRFQVDIDRQSAGRSFQQPASQGQSNGHSSQGESRNSGQEREEFTRETTPRRGMLNLVA